MDEDLRPITGLAAALDRLVDAYGMTQVIVALRSVCATRSMNGHDARLWGQCGDDLRILHERSKGLRGTAL